MTTDRHAHTCQVCSVAGFLGQIWEPGLKRFATKKTFIWHWRWTWMQRLHAIVDGDTQRVCSAEVEAILACCLALTGSEKLAAACHLAWWHRQTLRHTRQTVDQGLTAV